MDSITIIFIVLFLIPLLILGPMTIMLFFIVEKHDGHIQYVDDEPDGSNYVTLPSGEGD